VLGSPKLVETLGDHLPCGDALLISGNGERADARGNEARCILSVLPFNLEGAGPKLAIIRDH